MSNNAIPETAPRYLTVGSITTALQRDTADALIEARLVYECGNGHDLHLDPARDWVVEDVEVVVKALAVARTPEGR